MMHKIGILLDSLPPRTKRYLYLAVGFGIGVFGIEALLIRLTNSYFISIGILQSRGLDALLSPALLPYGIIAAAVLRFLIGSLRYYFNGLSANRLVHELRTKIIASLDPFSLGGDRHKITTYSYHTENAGSCFISISNVIASSVTTLLLIGYCLYLNHWLSLCALFLGAAGLSISLPLRKRLAEIARQVYLDKQQMDEHYLNLAGNAVLLPKAATDVFRARGLGYSKSFYDRMLRVTALNGFMRNFPELLGVIVIVVSVDLYQKSALSVSSINVSVLYLLIRAFQNLNGISGNYAQIISLTQSWTYAVASGQSSQSAPTEVPLDVDFRAISLVEFKAAHTAFTLDQTFLRGTGYHIRGPNGVGKTSLIRAITGFNSYVGQLHFDHHLHVPGLNPVCDVVTHTPCFFLGNFYENLRIWTGATIHPDEVSRVMELLDLDLTRDLREIDFNYIHQALSAGERQKLNLIRVFFEERPLIVLDEALSQVSETQERLILEELLRLKRNSILIVVSHSLRSPDFRVINV